MMEVFYCTFLKTFTFYRVTSENISYNTLLSHRLGGQTLYRPDISIPIPGSCQCIRPGDTVKLGRFEATRWQVGFGWFSFDENRPFYGIYLTNLQSGQVKPLLKTDLDDIYMIE